MSLTLAGGFFTTELPLFKSPLRQCYPKLVCYLVLAEEFSYGP